MELYPTSTSTLSTILPNDRQTFAEVRLYRVSLHSAFKSFLEGKLPDPMVADNNCAVHATHLYEIALRVHRSTLEDLVHRIQSLAESKCLPLTLTKKQKGQLKGELGSYLDQQQTAALEQGETLFVSSDQLNGLAQEATLNFNKKQLEEAYKEEKRTFEKIELDHDQLMLFLSHLLSIIRQGATHSFTPLRISSPTLTNQSAGAIVAKAREIVSDLSLNFVQQQLPFESHVREPYLNSYGSRKAAPIYPGVRVLEDRPVFFRIRGVESSRQVAGPSVQQGDPILILEVDSESPNALKTEEILPLCFAAAAYDTPEEYLDPRGLEIRKGAQPSLICNPHILSGRLS